MRFASTSETARGKTNPLLSLPSFPLRAVVAALSPAGEGTLQVLFTASGPLYLPASSVNQQLHFAVSSNGESPEMKAVVKSVIVVAVGLLTLQPVLVASAQEVAPSSDSAPQPLDPYAATLAVAGSSRGPDRLSTGDLASKAATQPGKADGTGDPALGGERHPLYRLSKSDTVDVSFTFSPDFNQTLTVQPDGFVFLRGAGAVVAEGLTVPQLQRAIAVAYTGILREPEITLTLKDFEKPYFLASGEVGRPGKYELRGDLTVNEAVAMAGGLTQQARHSQVVLFRRISSDVAEAHVVDLKKMLHRRDLREDLHLRPGDVVYVPQNRVSKVRKYMPTSALSWYMNPLQF
jgi:protein involved in polysaccharide export with SLBB domain